MIKFKISVEETLSRIVEVEASSKEEALDKVREQYKNEEIVLDAEDFCEVNIRIPDNVEYLISSLTDSEIEVVYRHRLFQHTKADVLSRIEEYHTEMSEENADSIAEAVAERWVKDGDYDCGLSYWDNIDNLVEEVMPREYSI